jgi:ABC-type multidrug transport system ATPase subunit
MTEFVIQVQSLSRAFGAKQALNNISLSIPKGTVLALSWDWSVRTEQAKQPC